MPLWPQIRPDSVRGFARVPGRHLPAFFFRQDEAGPSSTLELFEDGRRLGPPAAGERAVRREGGGRFLHLPGKLLFSTSDNSDPRTNGRRYAIRGLNHPRLAPLPVAILLLAWLAGAALLVAAVARRRDVYRVIAAPAAAGRGAFLTIFLLFAFCVYAFYFSRIQRQAALLHLLLLAAPAAFFLLFFRPRIALAKWMIWPIAFLLYATIGGAFGGSWLVTWKTGQSMLLTSALGLVSISAMRSGLAVRPRLGAAALQVLCGLLAVAILLSHSGFDLKEFATFLDDSYLFSLQDHVWNHKYRENWLLVLSWGAIAALAVRRRRRWRAAGLTLALPALAILSGYSISVKISLAAGIAIFFGSFHFPRAMRRAVAAAVVACFLLMPLFAGGLWHFAEKRPGILAATEGAAYHLARRIVIWKYSAHLVAERPWTGWGLGICRDLPGRRAPAREVMAEAPLLPPRHAELPPLRGGHPHNLPLLIWLETGAAGILLTVLFLGSIFGRIAEAGNVFRQSALLALVSSLLIILGLNYPAWEPTPQMLLIMTLGLVYSLHPAAPTGAKTRDPEHAAGTA